MLSKNKKLKTLDHVYRLIDKSKQKDIYRGNIKRSSVIENFKYIKQIIGDLVNQDPFVKLNIYDSERLGVTPDTYSAIGLHLNRVDENEKKQILDLFSSVTLDKNILAKTIYNKIKTSKIRNFDFIEKSMRQILTAIYRLEKIVNDNEFDKLMKKDISKNDEEILKKIKNVRKLDISEFDHLMSIVIKPNDKKKVMNALLKSSSNSIIYIGLKNKLKITGFSNIDTKVVMAAIDIFKGIENNEALNENKAIKLISKYAVRR